MRITFLDNLEENTVFTDELLYLSRFAHEIRGNRVLCINPRKGALPEAFLRQRVDLRFDSFVSDDEWLEPAEGFSEGVYFGYSHRPLENLPSESCDAVLVCEDMSLVDDEDAMFREYYRLLRRGGILLGGIWNISYHKYLIDLLHEVAPPNERLTDPVHGSGSFPVSTLVRRMGGLGFSDIEVLSLYGEQADVSKLVEISSYNGDEPAPEALFLTKTFLMKAVKG